VYSSDLNNRNISHLDSAPQKLVKMKVESWETAEILRAYQGRPMNNKSSDSHRGRKLEMEELASMFHDNRPSSI
jgi:hypothetical protein